MEIGFLKKVLMSDAEYWVVAKRNYVNAIGRKETLKDQIILILIPQKIKTGLKYEEITLQALEEINGLYFDQNIYLNEDYPPFQSHTSIYDVYDGHPIAYKIREFMVDALALQSDSLYEYAKLIQTKTEGMP